MNALAIDPNDILADNVKDTFARLANEVGKVNLANGWARGVAMRALIDSGDLAADDAQVIDQQIVDIALVMTEVAEAIEEVRGGHAMTETYYPTRAKVLFGQPLNDASAPTVAELEAMTEIKGLYFEDGRLHKPEGVPSELADAAIRLLHIADTWGIDLGAAVIEKLNYNATRGFRHGNKAA